jgi:multiple sugar transport system substrate-binding protein
VHRRWLSIGLVIAFGISASIIGSSPSLLAQGPVTLRMVWPGEANEINLYKGLAAKFEQRHPNVKVKLEAVVASSDPEYFQKVQVIAASGDYPDVIYGHYSWFPTALEKKFVREMDPYLKKAGLSKNVFFPTSIQQFSENGKLYAMPRETSAIALYYNADLFKQAGLKTPNEYFAEGQWTWDNYLDVAKKLTKDSSGHSADQADFNANSIVQWGTVAPVNMPFGLFPVVYSFGGDILDKSNTSCRLDQPEAVQGITFLQDLVRKHHVAVLPSQAQQTNIFANGKVGMMAGGYWEIVVTGSAIKNFAWDVAPLPKGKVQSTRAANGAYAIPARAKHPDDAWELIRFLSQPDNTMELAHLGLIIPALRAAAESPQFLTPGKTPLHRKVFVDALAYGRLDPRTTHWAEMVDAIGSEMDLVWAGQKAPEAGARDACNKVNAFLKK